MVVERKCCGCGEVVQRKWNGEEWRYLGIKKEEEMVYGFGEEFDCTRWLREIKYKLGLKLMQCQN